MIKKATLTAAFAIGFGHVALAAPIQILYDSFENLDFSPATSTTDNTPGWFETGHPNGSGTIHVDSGVFTTPYGDQALTAWQGTQLGAQRDLGVVLTADTDYAISFNVSSNNAGQGDWRAQLVSYWLDGSTKMYTVLDTVEGVTSSHDMSHAVAHTFDVSGGVLGEALEIRLIDPLAGELDGAWQHGPIYDNVSVTTNAVPEPGSLALLGLGGLLIARRRRD